MPLKIYNEQKVSHLMLNPSDEDLNAVELLNRQNATKKQTEGLITDVIAKPWGCEYMCGICGDIEIWELHLKPGCATSMHCHPSKDTLNIILEGQALFETLEGEVVMCAGDARLIKAGRIHSTAAKGGGPLRLIEIESPSDKEDLIRIKDRYGRENIAYETDSVFSGAVQKRLLDYDSMKVEATGIVCSPFMPVEPDYSHYHTAKDVWSVVLAGGLQSVAELLVGVPVAGGFQYALVLSGHLVPVEDKKTRLGEGFIICSEDIGSGMSSAEEEVRLLLW